MKQKAVAWMSIAIFGTFFSLFSVVRHLRLESYLFDLGYYDQYLWLASRFLPLYSSLQETLIFMGHFNPSMILLAPLYWFTDNVLLLLVVQGFVAAFGGYPLYLMAVKKCKSQKIAFTILFCYLMFFGVHSAISFDFHPLVLATTILSWMYYLYDSKNYKWFWIVTVVFVGLQENLFLIAAAFGLFLIFRYKDKKRGLSLFGIATFCYLFLVFVFIPIIGIKISVEHSRKLSKKRWDVVQGV